MTQKAKPAPEQDDLPVLMVVEDDPGLQRQMTWALSDAFRVVTAGDRLSALDRMSADGPQVVVLDLGLPPDPNGASEGLATLEQILTQYPTTKVLIASGNEERANARKAVFLGAYDFFSKPVDIDELRLILVRALRLQQLEAENRKLSQAVRNPLDGIIATSAPMMAVCNMVRRVAATNVSVLISGESGTGKELIARSLHGLSTRAAGPFIATNCAAIPENLLESELFGYERGAFTGAVTRTMGRIECANGGTLFLDEIGDMPISLQAKLLRFLQDHTFQRLGNQKSISVDVRIVSATNRNLAAMISAGTFREDLFFRLNEIGINLPPLRERDEDIVIIAQAALRRCADEYKRPKVTFSRQALVAMTKYPWPGNVRELDSRIKRGVLMAQGEEILAADLGLPTDGEDSDFPTLKDVRTRVESQLIRSVLSSTNGNLSQAAKTLGVSRPTLYSLMDSYAITAEVVEGG